MDPGIIGANAFIFYRVSITALLFYVITRPVFIFHKKDLLLLAACAFTGVIGNQLLFFNGLKNTSPIHAALIMVCTPLLVLLIKTLVGTSLQFHQWIGCMLGLTGAVYLIMQSGDHGQGTSSLAGDCMVLANALLYGYYLVKVPELISRYGAFKILTAMFAMAIVPVGLLAWPQLMEFQPWTMNTTQWMAFSFVLIATTFGAYALNAYALQHTNAEIVSAYIYLQPLIGTAVAIVTGKDQWQIHYGVAAVFIFGGLYLSGRKKTFFFQKKYPHLKGDN